LILNFPGDVPSATRSIGIVPFVFLFVARGLLFEQRLIGKLLNKLFKKNTGFLIGWGVLGLILIKIVMVNYIYYFEDYKMGLPNRNIGFAKEIASFIKQIPEDSNVDIVGSDWGEGAQPESRAIDWFLEKKRGISFIDKSDFICDLTKKKSGDIVIYDPISADIYEQVEECYRNMKPIYKKSIYGDKIFAYIEL